MTTRLASSGVSSDDIGSARASAASTSVTVSASPTDDGWRSWCRTGA